jgi:hypothetical protein
MEPGPGSSAGQNAGQAIASVQQLADRRDQADRLGLHVTTSQALAADPAGTALAALSHLPPGPLAVHVDVLDFTDAPLAENTDDRNRSFMSPAGARPLRGSAPVRAAR